MKSETKTIQDITHGILAVKVNPETNETYVLHFCGYFEEPSVADYDALRQELESDPEFGLTGEEYDLIPASEQMLQYVKDESNFPRS